MLDFMEVSERWTKNGIEILPVFIVKHSNDLMIRGGAFYAIWVEKLGRWSTDEQDAIDLIDEELDAYAEKNKSRYESSYRVLHLRATSNRQIDAWKRYCKNQATEYYHELDGKVIFSNMKLTKRDYASRQLPYPLEDGECPSWNRLMSVLYGPEETRKIEWAIGSIVSGDSKKIQKFLVLYGSYGTGKSTILGIIEKMFDGYCSVFDAKALGSSSNSFALEAFRSNPLVAIQDDGDLSRIEDNTRLNSLVSHETMIVNEKFKSTYATKFRCFLFMGTNKPVKITDSKSGLIRRLIDVSPTGEKLPRAEYNELKRNVEFEYGAIAKHCLDVYKEDPGYYDNYMPKLMMAASNDFYAFMQENYFVFKREDGVTQKAAWEMYQRYIEDAKVNYPLPLRAFKEELRGYFREYAERMSLEDGNRVRSYYSGFRTEKFETETLQIKTVKKKTWLEFKAQPSIFDDEFKDLPAQYGVEDGRVNRPKFTWEKCKTKLKDIDTKQLHYVWIPSDNSPILIIVDFDIPDENGNKSLELNIKAASEWPKTYAELSKSGQGIHLHYWYTGDPSKLAIKMPDNPHIEIKIPKGNASLRRKLSMCNDIPISTISSGLPLKEEKKKVVNTKTAITERSINNTIRRILKKDYENVPSTTSGINLISTILNDAYASDISYDVTPLRQAVINFAANSTHNKDYCLEQVIKMPFKSKDIPEPEAEKIPEGKLVFFDVEVFPNLLFVSWKHENSPTHIHMFNPKPEEVEELCSRQLIGFNCRRYDNHILYARAFMNYSIEDIYALSEKIINSEKKARNKENCFFGNAYNLSYTDVFDFCSKKQSLKKWEIELGIHHKELGIPWDKPVPESMWEKVAEYCDNDVDATEAVFHARQADFVAREILADVAGMTVNDTTNQLTTRIIFGKEKNPQSQFNYRNMGDKTQIAYKQPDLPWYSEGENEFTLFDDKGRPIFPGYVYEYGKSTYRGEEVGEGGYVYAEPGMYSDIALLDIASMHPSSIIAEQLFGKYTKRFQEIKDARVAIKHKDFETAKTMLDGKLAKYLKDENSADALAQALKIAINSVYGLTSASFENPFHDPRNVDNIVAKRGALFMINLKHEVQNRGYTVAHIKTDSIKIPNATPDIIKFVQDYGERYGYIFEHEATYDRMCLVNNAVYIARYATADRCRELYGYCPKDCSKHGGEWTATGTQFQIPYVFKTLFSHEDIQFKDLCETKSVTSSIYIDRTPEEAAEYIQNPGYFDDGSERIYLNDGHELQYVGKVGLFSPMQPGYGAGLLVREGHDKEGNVKYDSVTGTKGYLWMESEMVELLKLESKVDRSYYDAMVDAAVKDISKYGDFTIFTSEEPFSPVAPWTKEDGPWDDTTPFDVR